MSRRTCRISHDEVRRMVKAVQSCGLAVGKVVFDGETVSVVISGDSEETASQFIDRISQPEDCSDLDEYRTWRDQERAGGRA
jgi:hypothetical protein